MWPDPVWLVCLTYKLQTYYHLSTNKKLSEETVFRGLGHSQLWLWLDEGRQKLMFGPEIDAKCDIKKTDVWTRVWCKVWHQKLMFGSEFDAKCDIKNWCLDQSLMQSMRSEYMLHAYWKKFWWTFFFGGGGFFQHHFPVLFGRVFLIHGNVTFTLSSSEGCS